MQKKKEVGKGDGWHKQTAIRLSNPSQTNNEHPKASLD